MMMTSKMMAQVNRSFKNALIASRNTKQNTKRPTTASSGINRSKGREGKESFGLRTDGHLTGCTGLGRGAAGGVAPRVGSEEGTDLPGRSRNPEGEGGAEGRSAAGLLPDPPGLSLKPPPEEEGGKGAPELEGAPPLKSNGIGMPPISKISVLS